jgi:uncharacterized SAM-binding protein YcdF (DUF218 family)
MDETKTGQPIRKSDFGLLSAFGFRPSAMSRTCKWVIRLSVALLAAVLLLALVAFIFPQEILCVDSGDVHADVIVLLGGGAGERPNRVAELYRAGVAKTILVSGAGDTDDNRRLLVHRGVPASAIQMERDSKTTKENAVFSMPLLDNLGAKRVIIVTSWYHSRRALRCFQHYGPDIQFFSRPSYYAYHRNEWSNERTARRIRAEYTKMFWYCIRFGVWPV